MPETVNVLVTAIVRSPSGADEPGDRVGRLFDLGARITRAGGVHDTVRKVVLEQSHGDGVQRALGGGDLGEDVDAIRVLVDHPLKAADLPLYPAQPPEQGLLVTGVAVRPRMLGSVLVRHAVTIPPSRIL